MDDATFEVVLAAGFHERLLGVEAFLEAAGVGFAFDRLIDELEGIVMPNLRRFPRMGRLYAKRAFLSFEARSRCADLSAANTEALREYLHGDYLILYSVPVPGQMVYLLSIRHHRQLSFDFEGLWPGA